MNQWLYTALSGAMALSLARCAPRVTSATEETPSAPVESSGASADGLVARSALGLNFRLPADWAPAEQRSGQQWNGPRHTLFVVVSDPAADVAAHELNVQGMRARLTQEGWTFSDERAAPTIGPNARALEMRLGARYTVLHMPSWVATMNNRLVVVTCVYSAANRSNGTSACTSILGSMQRVPRTSGVPEGMRAVTLGSLSVAIPSDWTDQPQEQVRAFVSPGSNNEQIAFTMAMSPEAERVERVDVDEMRRRFSSNGGQVEALTPRTINGIEGFAAHIEQPQLERAAVTELAISTFARSRSVLAACVFASEDGAGREQCTRIMQTVSRAP